jgi:hypothetical protein
VKRQLAGKEGIEIVIPAGVKCTWRSAIVAPFEQGEIGPTCSGTPASWGSKAWSPSAAIRLIAQADRRTGSK